MLTTVSILETFVLPSPRPQKLPSQETSAPHRFKYNPRPPWLYRTRATALSYIETLLSYPTSRQDRLDLLLISLFLLRGKLQITRSPGSPPAKSITGSHAAESRRRPDVDATSKPVASHVGPVARPVVQLVTRHARVLLQVRVRYGRPVAAGLGVRVALVEGFLWGRSRGFGLGLGGGRNRR